MAQWRSGAVAQSVQHGQTRAQEQAQTQTVGDWKLSATTTNRAMAPLHSIGQLSL